MKWLIFFFFTLVRGQHWCKIPNTTVYVSSFLEKQDLTNCFARIEKDALFLKCWRNEELVDAHFFVNSIYI